MLVPGYYIIEQMGHVSNHGWAEEVEIAGVKMIAVRLPAVPGEEVPAKGDPGDWRYHPPEIYDPLREEVVYAGGPSLYRIRPSTEEEVLGARLRQRPCRVVRLALPAPEIEEAEVIEDGVPFDGGGEEA